MAIAVDLAAIEVDLATIAVDLALWFIVIHDRFDSNKFR